MIQNRRQMGESLGYWTGPEVERTQFYGLPTVFFSRLATAKAKLADPKFLAPFEHVFFAPVNPKFTQGMTPGDEAFWPMRLLDLVEPCLRLEKRVTAEILPNWLSYFTNVRERYPSTFCALIVLEVPKLELGGFAVKAAPPVVFERRDHEMGVLVAPSQQMQFTGWGEYEVDTDPARTPYKAVTMAGKLFHVHACPCWGDDGTFESKKECEVHSALYEHKINGRL